MIKPFAFVLMPFSSEFDDIYKLGIKSAADEVGILAERVDEQTFSETILERIYRQIDVADMIIADMTGQNPNVFYEVGLCHSKNKLCVLLTQNTNDIPFDLKHHRHIVYGGKISELKSKLIDDLNWLKDEVGKKKSEIFAVTLKRCEGFLAKDDWRAVGEMDLELEIHNNGQSRSPEIEAIYFHTHKNWSFSQDSIDCSYNIGDKENTKRHFLKAPVARLSPGAWAPIKMAGKKTYWNKFKGSELQEKYIAKGVVILEIVTSEGNFKHLINLDVTFEGVPF